jgi:nitrogen fixation NifU-like protein
VTDPREQLILELDRARHGQGEVGAEAVLVRSPTCGDEVRLAVTVEAGVITALRWTGRGCTVSMASASVLASLAVGMPVGELGALHGEFRDVVRGPVLDPLESDDHRLGDAMAFAGIGRLPLRAGCADLAWRGLERAVGPAGP